MWIAGAAFAIAIIVTIVVMTRSNHRSRSRQELVDATIAALAAGDVDKLVALSDSTNFDRLLDCRNTAAADVTAEQLERELRHAAERLVAKVSGRKLRVLAIENRDLGRDDVASGAEPNVFREGDKVLGPCRARTTFRGEEVLVTVEETRSGRRPQTKAVTLWLYEVDGAWYLVDAPRGRAENGLPALGEDRDE